MSPSGLKQDEMLVLWHSYSLIGWLCYDTNYFNLGKHLISEPLVFFPTMAPSCLSIMHIGYQNPTVCEFKDNVFNMHEKL